MTTYNITINERTAFGRDLIQRLSAMPEIKLLQLRQKQKISRKREYPTENMLCLKRLGNQSDKPTKWKETTVAHTPLKNCSNRYDTIQKNSCF